MNHLMTDAYNGDRFQSLTYFSMKKLLTLLGLTVFALALTGCTGNRTEETVAEETIVGETTVSDTVEVEETEEEAAE